MKQADIFSIILVASIGTFGAFFLCQSLMGDPKEATVEFRVLKEVIPSALASPDPEVFNATAINPTIEVYVGTCEDLDKNGILDEDELAQCELNKTEECPEGEECPEKCPEGEECPTDNKDEAGQENSEG